MKEDPKDVEVEVLFLEVDGLHVKLKNWTC